MFPGTIVPILLEVGRLHGIIWRVISTAAS
jgi:hypothetical protein